MKCLQCSTVSFVLFSMLFHRVESIARISLSMRCINKSNGSKWLEIYVIHTYTMVMDLLFLSHIRFDAITNRHTAGLWRDRVCNGITSMRTKKQKKTRQRQTSNNIMKWHNLRDSAWHLHTCAYKHTPSLHKTDFRFVDGCEHIILTLNLFTEMILFYVDTKNWIFIAATKW